MKLKKLLKLLLSESRCIIGRTMTRYSYTNGIHSTRNHRLILFAGDVKDIPHILKDRKISYIKANYSQENVGATEHESYLYIHIEREK